MRGTARTIAIAGISAVALLATACGGDSGTPAGNGTGNGTETGAAPGAGGGEIVVNGCTPENPLIAGNTSETCGGNILDTITAKLVHYNADDAAPENDIAEEITTEDNQNFTVKIKQGYKFHDGTEVKAKNFVDAWNYTAFGPNGQSGSYFFEPIEGYGDVSAEDATVEELSGLAVVDDYTFTIKTTAGLQPAGPSGLHRVRPAARLLLRRPRGLRQGPRGCRSVQADRVQRGHEHRRREVRRLLR